MTTKMRKIMIIGLMLSMLLIAGCGGELFVQEPESQTDHERFLHIKFNQQFHPPEPDCQTIGNWLKKQPGVIEAKYFHAGDGLDKPTGPIWHIKQKISPDSFTEYDFDLGNCQWAQLTNTKPKTKYITMDYRPDRSLREAFAKEFGGTKICPEVRRWLEKQHDVIEVISTKEKQDCRNGCTTNPVWHVRVRVSNNSFAEYDLDLGKCDYVVPIKNPGTFNSVGVAHDGVIQEQLEKLFPRGSGKLPKCDNIDTWLRNHRSVKKIMNIFIAEMAPPYYTWTIEYLGGNLQPKKGVVGSMCTGEISKSKYPTTVDDNGRIKGYLYDRLVDAFPFFKKGNEPNDDWPTCKAISKWLDEQPEVTSQKFKGINEVLFQYGEWNVTFRDGISIHTGTLKGSCY
jgi:hypothetical protein